MVLELHVGKRLVDDVYRHVGPLVVCGLVGHPESLLQFHALPPPCASPAADTRCLVVYPSVELNACIECICHC